MALITVVFAAMLLLGAGAAAAMLGAAETGIAFADRSAREALYVADAGAQEAIDELAQLPSYSAALTGQGRLAGGSTVGQVAGVPLAVDLVARGNALQGDTDAASPWGADTPAWHLFMWGPAALLMPAGIAAGPFFVAVWTADNGEDGDGNPAEDTDGIVIVHAEAYGPDGVRRAVECSVKRGATGAPPRILSWHELRPI
jgi:hypothetical protein